MSPRRLLAALSLLLLLWPAATVALDAALVDSLRAGGYVIYLRHAATDMSQRDRNREAGWESCDPGQMRQLSETGRGVARRLGEALRRLRIPVGRIVASEFCRTLETARLLDLGPVESSRDLLNATHAEQVGGTHALRRRVARLLATPPAAGTNTVLVGHGNVFMLVAERRPVEAGAAIVRPDGEGGFEVLAQVEPEEWIERADTR